MNDTASKDGLFLLTCQCTEVVAVFL